jgi:hypothetical protein
MPGQVVANRPGSLRIRSQEDDSSTGDRPAVTKLAREAMHLATEAEGRGQVKRDRARALPMPRLEDILFVALIVLVVMLGPRLLNIDGDLGRHLTIGQYMIDTGRIPTTDLFSHTRTGEQLTPHEWLSEVALALAYRVLGLDGVVLLSAVLLAATFWLTYHVAVRRSGLGLASLALTLLAAAASSLHWLPRPHLFTLLLAVVWTDGLEKLARGSRSAWWHLPLLMLAWANLHGAFVFGFVIWMAYAVDWAWSIWRARSGREGPQHGWQLVAVGLASLAATLVNPVGARLWVTSIGFAGNAYLVGHTAEYLSPNFHDVSTWPFLAMILASPWIMAAGRRSLTLRSILLLFGWTALGLYSVRHVPVYAVIAVPILAEALGDALGAAAAGQAWLAREARLRALEAGFRRGLWPAVCVLAVALLMALGVRLTPAPAGNAFSPRVFPVQAVDWALSDHPGDRVFNYFPWGGYLLFRGWPDLRVFIDGQTDFYGEALTREYETVITVAEGWEQVLERYGVDWVVMPTGSRLVGVLRRDAGWAEVYSDSTAAILQRIP